MPLVAKVIVTVSYVASDSVAVRVIEVPAFSAIEDALVDKATVGADSFSVMVIVSDWVPLSVASAPETLSMDMMAVSSPS